MRFETERLIIREWLDSDRAPYASFNADPVVRRFYPDMPTTEASNALVDRFIAGLAHDGFGFLAVQRKSDGSFIGDVGIMPVKMPLRGNPPVEVGWLLGQAYWGQGYAPEAARAWIDFAFTDHAFPEIVAFTARLNLPSQRVMQKLGMRYDPQADFEHPNIPEGHALRPHLLYRLANPNTA
ncbi:GNAT family N-acetyltransferase [uncultured Devosia sp.]|uniref:GNAT family N-acetyltransferase n=1 Tax=uncultured Devosia sp. TaxID=211434 RepID=UPI0035CC42DB